MSGKPLHIGYDAKRLFTNTTGLGNYSRTLVANLATAFPENTYVLFSPEIRKNERTEPFLTGQPYLPVYPPRKSPFWRTGAIPRTKEFRELDLFHGLSHELPVGIVSTGMPSIVTIHDLIFKYYPGDYPWFDRVSYELKFRSACQRATQIVAISEQTKRDIIQYYSIPEEKIKVIYQACHPSFYDKKDADNIENVKAKHGFHMEYLLYVGSIISRKNLLNLVKALELLPPDLQLPLVVIGKGKKYREEVHDFLKGYPLKESVIFTENIPFSDFPAIYQGAKALIYPSFHEGFGLPVLEGIVSGIPVLTSNRSSLTEAGGEAAFYCDPASPESIAESIGLILRSDEAVQEKKAAAKAHIQQFDPALLSGQMMELYRGIL